MCCPTLAAWGTQDPACYLRVFLRILGLVGYLPERLSVYASRISMYYYLTMSESSGIGRLSSSNQAGIRVLPCSFGSSIVYGLSYTRYVGRSEY